MADGTAIDVQRAFAQRMQQLREADAMTQTDLANAARAQGLPFYQQTIQRIETGQRPVRLDEAYIIAAVFQIDLHDMVNGASVVRSERLNERLVAIQAHAADVTVAVASMASDMAALAVEVARLGALLAGGQGGGDG